MRSCVRACVRTCVRVCVCFFLFIFNTAILSGLLLYKPRIVLQHVSGHEAYF